MSGKVAQFEYMNERRLPAKTGLLEILGYISKVKEGKETRYLIHHELMPYYTVQTTLQEEQEGEAQEVVNSLQELEGSSEVSKEEMRVCSLYIEPHSQLSRSLNHAGLEEEVSVGETSVSPRTERLQRNQTNIEASENKRGDMGGDKKKEEEAIDSTHTNQLSESESISDMPQYALTPEEEAILNAKPLDSEPNRAQIKWRGSNG
ncbi:MAG: hypothetical protein QXJ11_06885 [Candidatus Bathyarchaeia archaeon]